jgi:hypothetical protein
MAEPTPPLHPDVAALAGLLGTWRGEGGGEYPTIASFGYGAEVGFWHIGKPFLAYAQRTWSLDDGRPLHTEAGYWRPKPGGVVEVVLSNPNGIVEVLEGHVDGGRIELDTTTVATTSTAKEVTALRRRFNLDGDILAYTVDMAAVGQPLQPHLSATLRRAG